MKGAAVFEPGVELRVGVDCEEIARWRALVPRLESAAVSGLFTPREHEYCRSVGDPASSYAGGWCAKEAVVKALAGLGPLTMRDVEIRRDGDGCPYAVVATGVIDAVDWAVTVSIAHSSETAIAFAVATIRRGPSARG